ncbi:MAG: F0F1 ATP synthase subunit epsilon [Sphingomonadales bacterium]
MAGKLSFELVSPERLLMSLDAAMVVVPGAEGDFGVLAGHAPFMSTVRPGVVSVYREEGVDAPERLFVAGGFADVADDRLTILAEQALLLSEADPEKVSRQLADAREDLADAKTDHERAKLAEDVARLEALMAALSS